MYFALTLILHSSQLQTSHVTASLNPEAHVTALNQGAARVCALSGRPRSSFPMMTTGLYSATNRLTCNIETFSVEDFVERNLSKSRPEVILEPIEGAIDQAMFVWQ